MVPVSAHYCFKLTQVENTSQDVLFYGEHLPRRRRSLERWRSKILNDIFSRFDMMVEKYRLEKMETIGDAYMVAYQLAGTKLRSTNDSACCNSD